MVSFYHCSCATVVLTLLFVAAVAEGELPECTDADWIAEYTECRVSSNTRDLLFFKNPDTPECSGGVPCPQSIFNLRCDIACGPGHYLPLGSTTCESCSAGTFSVGSGDRATDFSKFPFAGTDGVFHFTTYSVDTYSGEKYEDKGLWASADGGLSIISGAINNSQSSYLVLPILLVMDGNVTFEYTVEAEYSYDGLEFYLDGVKVMPLDSQQTKPVVFTIAATRGYHTLTWRYMKDISSSVGADAAWIHLIEIQGITYSEDSCQPCPAGYFADAEGSSKCTACPRNTYAADPSSTECAACGEYEYSLEGASSCLPRIQCTDLDYTSSYTDCAWSSTLNKFVRDKKYSWLPTTTCNFSNSELPPDELNLDCELCNPGLVRNRETGKCTWCPAGSVSDSTTNECTPCPAGFASNPGLFYKTWIDGGVADVYGVFNTSCEGTCGTPGWIISDGVLMSGLGHSNAVTSILEMRFTLERASTIDFTYFVYSKNIYDARLTVADRDGLSMTYWSGMSMVPTQDSLSLDPGTHTIEFTFVRRSVYSLISSDAAYLYNISIPGAIAPLPPASGGRSTGSDTCVPCKAGTYTSVEGQEWCSLCEPGSSTAEAGASSCSSCPKDTFNDVAGGLCRACGPNVHTEGEGSLDCDNTCSFRYDSGVENVVYDLTPLARGGVMYGPIQDTTKFSYFFSVCQRNSGDNTTSPCKDVEGNPLHTYSCQQQYSCIYDETCFDFDTGNIPGYSILNESNPREGFVLTYTGGTVSSSGYHRSTNITFICTPGGGIGAPHAPENSTIENPKCHYNFVWETEYGCPLCTEADYSFIYGECKNNLRRKMYYWLSNPRHCHDGVSLPEDEDIPTNCTSKIICEPGFYVDGIEQNCTPCAPGTSSLGTGELLTAHASTAEDGPALPSQLSSTCHGEGCQPFIVDHRQYHASTLKGTDTVLRYTTRFLINGTITFSYSMLASLDDSDTSSFVFSVDDNVVMTDTNASLHSATVSFPVTEGGRTLTWTVNGATRFVDIDYILAYGNTYAPTSCSACMSGYYQDEAGQGECKRCPVGQVSAPGFTGCQECPQGMYTIDGIECVAQRPCTEQDWVSLYTPCTDRKRKLVWSKLYPAVCAGGYEPEPLEGEEIDCAPCPSGTWREEGSDECVGCKLGEVFNNGACVKPDAGTVSYHTATYFFNSAAGESTAENVLPKGWSTFALSASLPEGMVQGWRIRPDGIDAGLSRANETVVSVLSYTDSGFLGNGFVMFDYRLTEEADEMLFFINGEKIDLNPTSLPNGFNRVQSYIHWAPGPSTLSLSWIAVLKSTIAESAATAMVQNVRIGGVSNGMATTYYCDPGTEANEEQSYCITCNPGTASNVSGSACRECASGTYASRSGQNKCNACYSGTKSESDTASKRCITTCLFNGNNNTLYNLTTLKNSVIGPVKALGGSFFFSVCDGFIPKGKCNSEATEDAYMHACHASAKGPEQDDFGSELEYVLAEKGSSEDDLSFLINFRDGSLCPDGNNNERLQTTILFRCNPTAGTGFPQFLSYSSSTCTATFSWASQYACHTCKDDDYEKVVSACTKGLQRTEKHKIGRCNGEDRILVEETECTDIAVPIGIVAGAAGLILIMIGVIVFVVYKNRKITYKYTKLLQDQAAELEAMADEDDEGGNNSMSKKLAPVSQDEEEDEEDEDGKKKKKGEDDEDELQDDEEEEDDGQGVGHIRK